MFISIAAVQYTWRVLKHETDTHGSLVCRRMVVSLLALLGKKYIFLFHHSNFQNYIDFKFRFYQNTGTHILK